jgi:hypothetical protein
MSEGTIFWVLGFPQPWPPRSEVLVARNEQATIRALPDGHLQFTVDQQPPDHPLQFDTPELVVEPGGRAIVALAWSNGQIQVYLNSQKILSADTATEPLHVNPSPTVVEEKALGHPDALQKCQRWIQWRKTQLVIQRNARFNRRSKTNDEQVDELRAAIATVRHLCGAIQSGEVFLIGSLAATLRSLLFWKQGSQYDPLLLRLAAPQDLPLPVFAFPKLPTQPPIVDEANYHLNLDIASLKRKYPGQELMDIQDALLNSVQIQRVTGVNGGKAKVDTLTAIELIAQTANMLGTAHFDSDIGLALDRLRSNSVWEVSALTRLIWDVGLVTADLGEYVLRETSASP